MGWIDAALASEELDGLQARRNDVWRDVRDALERLESLADHATDIADSTADRTLRAELHEFAERTRDTARVVSQARRLYA